MDKPLRHVATEPSELKKLSTTDSVAKSRQKHGQNVRGSDSVFNVNIDSTLQETPIKSSRNKQTELSSSSFSSVQSSKHQQHHKMEWEVLEGLREGQRCDESPVKREGYLLKRRKWPMKGWHKRYFVLENGSLTYAKTSTDISKGKLLGEVNVGLSVISTKSRGRRIDIDAEEAIYHLKVKTKECFEDWVASLKHHRLYRQHKIAFGQGTSAMQSPVCDFAPRSTPADKNIRRNEGSNVLRSPGLSNRSRVAAWLTDGSFFESCNKDLCIVQDAIHRLESLMEQLEDISGSVGDVNAESLVSFNIQGMAPLSTSNPNLSSLPNNELGSSLKMDSSLIHVSPSVLEHKSDEKYVQESFVVTAKHAITALQTASKMVILERERIRQVLELENLSRTNNFSPLGSNLNYTLMQALQQNAELKSRLSKIHAESEISESSASPDSAAGANHHSLSYESSSVVSISEYYDAAEYLLDDDSSSEISASDEEEDEGSFTSDNSEAGTDETPAPSLSESQGNIPYISGRRTKLPVPKPEVGDVNLWSLLRRNIGKDLSKISMPVTLNEPLNTLQRLCEELEYSDLLDKAAETDNPYERMVLIAAFAVSSYSTTSSRAAHKPFNPLLGETYECIREDKGFRFIAEQVSHHPPVSACHAESKNFIFWQDMRVKTTFWGKSMEVQPLGTVHVILPKYNEHYRWNKVTSCIHNVFGGQRWVDLYGELLIYCGDVKCKLTFAKASQWSNKQYEVMGSVGGKDSKTVHSLFGKWNEALYCGVSPSARCIWRIGALPEDSELYYGFTRFAIELNELEPDVSKFLPLTDSRFRPDQRLLEEGNITAAESVKIQLEQGQRDRKKKREEKNQGYEPLWFKKTANTDDNESWEFTGNYWTLRKNPGFINVNVIPRLW